MKRIFLTLTAAAVLAASAASMSVHAANSDTASGSRYASVLQIFPNGQWTVINDEKGREEIKELLEKCGINLDALLDNICPNRPGNDTDSSGSDSPEATIPAPPTEDDAEADAPDGAVTVTPTPAPDTSEETQPVPPTKDDAEADTPDSAVTTAPTPAPDTSEGTPTVPPTKDDAEADAPDGAVTAAPTPAPDTSEGTQPVPPTTEDTDVSGSTHPYVLRIVELVNIERANAGLNPVALSTNASAAALVRSKEIVKSFSHTRPDGRSFTTALKEQGINYRYAGENIAWGQRSPEQVMEAWMNSSGHRANILNANFTHIGVGYYQENGTNYWTQLFYQ